MDLLKKSTILYLNQARQENFEILIGKGFSEALSWRRDFKRIIFLCYSLKNEPIYKRKYENCYLIGLPFDLSTNAIKSVFNLGKNYLNLFLFMYRLTKIVQIDIIRMENLLLSGLPVFLINKIRKIPYLIWLGGYERKSLNIKYGKTIFTLLLSYLIILLEKVILRHSRFVLPVTEELMDLAEKRKVKNKIISPNYVDLTIFKNNRNKKSDNSEEKIQLLFVGRFEEEKGIKTLLKANKILLKKRDNFELSLIGDGSLKGWIKDYIMNNNIKNVKFLGKFDHSSMPALYNKADIFILPSYTEGSPASLLEAMSCGTPSIATSVGLCKKIIKNGENGILVPPGDPNKISEAINNIMKNKNLQEKLSKNGRGSIIKYTKNYFKIHKYVYEKILNQLIN